MVQWLRLYASISGHKFNPWSGNQDSACLEVRPEKKRGGWVLTKGAWIRGSINAANRGDSTELAHRAWHGIGVQLIVTFLSFLDAWDAYYGMCLQAL